MANDLQLPLQPLYKERARKLEVLSDFFFIINESSNIPFNQKYCY